MNFSSCDRKHNSYQNKYTTKQCRPRDMTPYPVRIVVPDADARSFDWFGMPSDEDDYTEYARSVMDEYFPIVAEDSYVEQG